MTRKNNMSTEKYAKHISNEIATGLYEAKQQIISIVFKNQKDADKFYMDAFKLKYQKAMEQFKNKVRVFPKDESSLFKIMTLIDKYNGTINPDNGKITK